LQRAVKDLFCEVKNNFEETSQRRDISALHSWHEIYRSHVNKESIESQIYDRKD
jgi:hypothetical protein